MSKGLLGFVTAQDVIADAHRRRDAEWLEMHRRPDAGPLPPEPDRAFAIRLPSIGRLVGRASRSRTTGSRAGL